MKNIISSFIKEFIKVVIIVAVAVPTIALFAAWTGPTGAPPTNNADAPVNVGIATQQKNGNLAVNSFRSFYDTYLATDGGNVGIGTVSPQAPAPNNLSGNVDANDVYLRSTGKWVSEVGGGVLPSPVWLGKTEKVGVFLKDGARAETYCGLTRYGSGSTRYLNGNLQTRFFAGNGTFGCGQILCDTGWINGPYASCSSLRKVCGDISAFNYGGEARVSPEGLEVELLDETLCFDRWR